MLRIGKAIKGAEKSRMEKRRSNHETRQLAAPGRHRRMAAFTLVELILVMAMLAIVLAVAAPSLSNFFRGRTLDSEARRFVSLTRYGQSRAVSDGVPMLLWIDTRQRAYGLEEQSGYSDMDLKAVELGLGKDLTIEATDIPAQTGGARPEQGANRNVPTIRFLPDGFMSETSPRSVALRDRNGETIWVNQSRNRLSYEIQTNAWQTSLR
jgi:type II secretion system protein H